MEIEGEYRIAASREAVWTALNDPEMLQKCIPGCESLEKISDTQLKARIKAAIGPVKATFNTEITLEDVKPPEHYTLVGQAKAGAAGFGRGSATVNLSEIGQSTLLHYAAELKVGGKLAQIGSRLVLGATRKTADDFFGTFSSALDPGAVKLHEEEPDADAPAGIKARLAVAAVMVVLLIWWFLLR